jgi:predicted DNA-binding ArsR family transcriptional regulator
MTLSLYLQGLKELHDLLMAQRVEDAERINDLFDALADGWWGLSEVEKAVANRQRAGFREIRQHAGIKE